MIITILQHQIKPIRARFGYKDKTDYGAKGQSFGGERERVVRERAEIERKF